MRVFLLALVLVVALNAKSFASEAYCEMLDDPLSQRLSCLLDTLSWVEVIHQGDHADHFSKVKSDYERYLRLRLRNDVSFLKHETVNYSDAYDKYDRDPTSDEMRSRGALHCSVWWIGESDFPIAQHTECTLSGYGIYPRLREEFGIASLGFGNLATIDSQTKDAFSGIIEIIATQLFEDRDLKPLQRGDPTSN